MEDVEDLGGGMPRFDVGTVADSGPPPAGLYWERVAEDMFVGKSLRGWPGCQARALRDALQGMPQILLTDRRMLRVHQTDGAASTWCGRPIGTR